MRGRARMGHVRAVVMCRRRLVDVPVSMRVASHVHGVGLVVGVHSATRSKGGDDESSSGEDQRGEVVEVHAEGESNAHAATRLCKSSEVRVSSSIREHLRSCGGPNTDKGRRT